MLKTLSLRKLKKVMTMLKKELEMPVTKLARKHKMPKKLLLMLVKK